MLGCIGLCSVVLVRVAARCIELVCVGLCWFVLVCVGLCWVVLGCAALCWVALVCVGCNVWSVLLDEFETTTARENRQDLPKAVLDANYT